MGSPLSGPLPDEAMKQFETKAFGTLRPRLWISYADDTFLVLEKFKRDEFQTLVPEIEFTWK